MANEKRLSSGAKLTKNDICLHLIADCDIYSNKNTRRNSYHEDFSDYNTQNDEERLDEERRIAAEKEEEEIRELERLDQEERERQEYERRLDEIHSKYGYGSDMHNTGDLDAFEEKARSDDYWYNWS